jgi:hypothetical protein
MVKVPNIAQSVAVKGRTGGNKPSPVLFLRKDNSPASIENIHWYQ